MIGTIRCDSYEMSESYDSGDHPVQSHTVVGLEGIRSGAGWVLSSGRRSLWLWL